MVGALANVPILASWRPPTCQTRILLRRLYAGFAGNERIHGEEIRHAFLHSFFQVFERTIGDSTDTNVEPGFNFLGGLEFPNNVFAEIRVGLIDSPRVKFGFGYTFR